MTMEEERRSENWKVAVKWSLAVDRVISPFYGDGSVVTAESYYHLPGSSIFQCYRIFLQIFSARRHPTSLWQAVRILLSRELPNCHSGGGDPINWAARSPSLKPVDHFSRRYVKEVAYRTRCTSNMHVKWQKSHLFGTYRQVSFKIYGKTCIPDILLL